MITNDELYGTDYIPPVSEEVCDGRLLILKERLEEEASRHYMKQNNDLINKLTKAIKFWERLRDGEEEYE